MVLAQKEIIVSEIEHSDSVVYEFKSKDKPVVKVILYGEYQAVGDSCVYEVVSLLQKEVKLAKVRSQQRAIKTLVLLLIGTIVVGGIILFYFLRYRSLYKELEIHKEELMSQKYELEQQSRVLAESNEELNESLRYASQIISLLMPTRSELQKYFKHFLIYRPKNIVSGDFYQVFKKGNKVFFILADSSGHGVPGALISTLSIIILDRIFRDYDELTVELIHQELSKEIRKYLRQDQNLNSDGLDLGILEFERFFDELKVRYLGLHRDLIYYNPEFKMIFRSKAQRGYIGGGIQPKQIIVKELLLPLDTVFYMFTDGFIDQFNFYLYNTQGYKSGRIKLVKILNNIADKPFSEQYQIINRMISQWLEYEPVIDDITFVALKYNL